jgi:hypothetical protein
MTWNDYRPIPGRNWADPSIKPERGFRLAVVGIDFPGQPFVVSFPKGSDPFGNPQIDPVAREKVSQFYADFFMKPSETNHGQTINGYWMEQSRGKFGITEVEVFGPYRMPKPIWAYGLNEYGQNDETPDGTRADSRMERDCDAVWMAELGPAPLRELRRDGRLAGVRRDEVQHQGGHPAGMGQSQSGQAPLDPHPVRRVDELAGRLPAVGPVLNAPGREFGHDHPRARSFRLQPPRPQQ